MNSSELLNYPYFAQVEQCTGLHIVDVLGKGQFGVVFSTNDDRLVIKLTLDKQEALLASKITQIRGRRSKSKGLGPSSHLSGIVFLFGIYTVLQFKGNDVYAIVREVVEPINKHRLSDYKDLYPNDLYPNIDKVARLLSDLNSEAADYHRGNESALSEYNNILAHLDDYAPDLVDTFYTLIDNDIIMKDTHIGNIGISTINWGKYRKPGELVLFDLGFTPTNNDYELMVCQ